MKEYQSLSHTRWDCKYHGGIYSKASQGGGIWRITKASGRDISGACVAKGIEGHLMADHVHMCLVFMNQLHLRHNAVTLQDLNRTAIVHLQTNHIENILKI